MFVPDKEWNSDLLLDRPGIIFMNHSALNSWQYSCIHNIVTSAWKYSCQYWNLEQTRRNVANPKPEKVCRRGHTATVCTQTWIFSILVIHAEAPPVASNCHFPTGEGLTRCSPYPHYFLPRGRRMFFRHVRT